MAPPSHVTGARRAAPTRTGAGVALIPRLAVPEKCPSGVAVRPLDGRLRPARHVDAAVRAGADRSPAPRALQDAGQA